MEMTEKLTSYYYNKRHPPAEYFIMHESHAYHTWLKGEYHSLGQPEAELQFYLVITSKLVFHSYFFYMIPFGSYIHWQEEVLLVLWSGCSFVFTETLLFVMQAWFLLWTQFWFIHSPIALHACMGFLNASLFSLCPDNYLLTIWVFVRSFMLTPTLLCPEKPYCRTTGIY